MKIDPNTDDLHDHADQRAEAQRPKGETKKTRTFISQPVTYRYGLSAVQRRLSFWSETSNMCSSGVGLSLYASGAYFNP